LRAQNSFLSELMQSSKCLAVGYCEKWNKNKIFVGLNWFMIVICIKQECLPSV
jgi:hypothetical protein